MKKFLVFILALFSLQFSLSQTPNTNIASELQLETINNISTFKAKVSNKTDVYYNLKYVISVTFFDENFKSLNKSLKEFLGSKDISNKTLEDFLNSQDSSNYTSRESSEDFFSLDPYQSKNVYQKSIETGSKSRIIVLMLVYDEDNKLISKDRVILNEDKIRNNDKITEQKKPRDGLEITGIVVDETKTKIGKDFYDRFYYYYANNNIRGDQVVKVDEMFTFRRTTKIIVKIGDEIIFEFFARPNEEYIEDMAKLTVQRVYKYFEIRKKEKSYISQY